MIDVLAMFAEEGDRLERAVKKELTEHMENQPEHIECSYCGEALEVAKWTVDKDTLHLTLTIKPCEECMERNYNIHPEDI